MTVPIARRGRDALRDRRAAAALLLLRPRLPRGAPAPRADARVPAGRASSWSARRRPTGTAEALTRAVPRARRRRAARLPRSASATRRCTRRCCAAFDVPERGARRGCCTSSSTRDFVGLEREVARARPAAEAAELLVARAAAARRRPRCSTRAGPGGRGRRRAARDARRCSTPAVAERVIFDLGLVARPGLLHGRGVRRLRPGARRADRRRRALRRPARALRPAAARGRLRARRRPAAPRAGRARSDAGA